MAPRDFVNRAIKTSRNLARRINNREPKMIYFITTHLSAIACINVYRYWLYARRIVQIGIEKREITKCAWGRGGGSRGKIFKKYRKLPEVGIPRHCSISNRNRAKQTYQLAWPPVQKVANNEEPWLSESFSAFLRTTCL